MIKVEKKKSKETQSKSPTFWRCKNKRERVRREEAEKYKSNEIANIKHGM